nr:methyl-accepting chemotaxis protein [Bacteroidota bacterium]
MKFRFTVKTKLIVGFGIIIIGVFISSILTYTTLDNSRRVSDSITKIYSPSVSYLNDLLFQINNSKMLR